MKNFFIKLFGYYLVFMVAYAGLSSLMKPVFALTKNLSNSPTASDDAIENFLFRMPEAIKEKVKALDTSPVQNLYVPVLFDVKLGQIEDSWNQKRSGGRVHKGTDILAARGSFVVSPTAAVVTNVGYDNLGGNYVLTVNQGNEQFYYAHLESAAPGVTPGKVLAPGDLIGFVGNTGDARHTVTHLHLGIYYNGVATDPYPRLTQEFSLAEKAAMLEKIVDGSNTPFSLALQAIDGQQNFIQEIRSQGLSLPKMVNGILGNSEVLAKARLLGSDMQFKSQGEAVRLLQRLLIKENSGPSARALAKSGSTGYFGMLTKNALAEYQKVAGIIPAQGKFGPLTRAQVLNLLANNVSTSTVSEVTQETKTFVQASSSVSQNLTIELNR